MQFIALFIFVLVFMTFCSRESGTQQSEGAIPSDQSSGYLSISDWEKAKLQITMIENINKNELDSFLRAYGLVLQYREFGQIDQALEAVKLVPSKLDTFAAAVQRIKSVPNYKEIDQMRDCLAGMVPYLRRFTSILHKSIEAGKAGNISKENSLKNEYTAEYRQAMALYRRMFDILGDTLTRGGRTESQKLTGIKTGGPAIAKSFRELASTVASKYRGILAKDIPEAEGHASERRYDMAISQSGQAYTSIQRLIMDLNWLDPGNEKSLWEAKTTLITALSYRMFTMQKYKEYLEKMKTGDAKGAGGTKKIYDIAKKSADDEWAKYRRLRF